MKWIVLLVPLLGVSAFAGYYHYWNATGQKAVVDCKYPRREALYDDYRHRNARRDAEDDFARGHPRLLTYGLPVPWTRQYGEILKRDYGVELETVAGCVVSAPLVDYVAAYNQTIEGYLVSVHGPDIFDRAHTEAQALYARHRAP